MQINKNIPNYLTVFRIAIIPFIIVSFYFESSEFAHRCGGIIFAIASLTDFFDGYLARKYKILSNLGRILDPIADKILVTCVLVLLVKAHRASEIPCLLILVREFIITGLREFLSELKVSIPVTKLSKIKTSIQMFSMTMLIIGSVGSGIKCLDLIGHTMLWFSSILTLITAYFYIQASIKYF